MARRRDLPPPRLGPRCRPPRPSRVPSASRRGRHGRRDGPWPGPRRSARPVRLAPARRPAPVRLSRRPPLPAAARRATRGPPAKHRTAAPAPLPPPAAPVRPAMPGRHRGIATHPRTRRAGHPTARPPGGRPGCWRPRSCGRRACRAPAGPRWYRPWNRPAARRRRHAPRPPGPARRACRPRARPRRRRCRDTRRCRIFPRARPPGSRATAPRPAGCRRRESRSTTR
ncbi:Uncharacterised protein [Achromobacter xylosoxidans]|nr:Uncharacterised protein [Achromobacter xylosoxidans]